MIWSMCSGSATPSSHAQNASLIIGASTRLLTNPGRSLAGTGVLPIFFASSSVRRVVSSLVARPLTTSTSFMTGTGLKKCMPITRWASSPTAVASSVIEIDDVFVASTTSGRKVPCIWRKTFFFRSIFSSTASTAQSASAASARSA